MMSYTRTAAIGLLMLAGSAPHANASLTEGARLAAVYDLILDARFDRVDAELARACPPAPAEACRALAVEALWWQILLNPESRALDQRFESLAAGAIAATDAWTRREPLRGEAWFYLAGSYGPLVQWRVQRGQYLAAAREGKKIKTALERALELDPTLEDAYFGIGLYHYIADVAPAALRWLRWLLLLPGGDRVAGLEQMLRARNKGELLRGEADYQLQFLYLRYEQQPAQALTLLQSLDARYRHNPLFLRRMAEIRNGYLRDRTRSTADWRELIDRARAGSVYLPRATEVRARLGLADTLADADQVDAAEEQLRIVVDMRPADPAGALDEARRRLQTMRQTPARP